jgi:hypothetical protein
VSYLEKNVGEWVKKMDTVSPLPSYESVMEPECPTNETINNAELLPGTIEEYVQSRERAYAQTGHLFKDFDDFETFHMLPLSKKQKKAILLRAIELDTAPPVKEEIC